MAKTKAVTLESGRIVTIKPLGPLGWMQVYGHLPDLSLDPPSDEMEDEKRHQAVVDNVEHCIRFVCACAVDPGFTRDAQQVTNGTLSVDDLSMEELGQLYTACQEISRPEKRRENIRPLSQTETG